MSHAASEFKIDHWNLLELNVIMSTIAMSMQSAPSDLWSDPDRLYPWPQPEIEKNGSRS